MIELEGYVSCDDAKQSISDLLVTQYELFNPFDYNLRGVFKGH